MKREHKIDIAPLLKGGGITDSGWTGKEYYLLKRNT